MRVGIDASNLRQGGGITHLVQLLEAADPAASGIDSVRVWGGRPVLDLLPERGWLDRVQPALLDGGGLTRAWWQHRALAPAAAASVDLLFCPGGSYLGRFHPFVTMFRNMLPFDDSERRRHDASAMRLKLEVLRAVQAATFRRADGVIFLNDHARTVVAGKGIAIAGAQAVIPHGLDPRFAGPLRKQKPMTAYSFTRPFRWLYVSAIHAYKRPWHVAEAIAGLRVAGTPVTLDFVGPPYPAAMARLQQTLDRLDPDRVFIRVTAGVSHRDLPEQYRNADAFVFASTCENMPNSLLEAMAGGLPIACSDRPPMPGILQEGGVYFDPESPASIAAALTRLMSDPALRTRVSAAAQILAGGYSWTRCARDTFDFLAKVSGS
jgi:glycosyltransferase involved in cell wall biosynthesis